MNDEELEQRLHEELHRRIAAPTQAPQALRSQVELLGMRQPVRAGGGAGFRVGRLGGLAAAAAIVALLATALFWRQPDRGPASSPVDIQPAVSVEMFGRIDATSAWAQSGGDLYVTRDDGATWARRSLPGLVSDTEVQGSLPGSPAPTLGPAGLATQGLGYSVFADPDHGWVVGWTVVDAGAAPLQSPSTLTVYRTVDGGQTWSSTQLPGEYLGRATVGAIDRDHAWMLATPATASDSASPGDSVAPQNPWATPGTALFTTSDGGVHWQQLPSLRAGTLVQFASATEAWGFDDPGVAMAMWGSTPGLTSIAHSTDAGGTWTTSALPVPLDCTETAHLGIPAFDPHTGRLAFEAACFRLVAVGPSPAPASDAPQGYSQASAAVLTFDSSDGGHSWILVSRQEINQERVGYLDPMTVNYNYSRWSLLWSSPGQPIPMFGYPTGGIGSFRASFDGGRTWVIYSTAGLRGIADTAQWVSQDDVWVLMAPLGDSGPGNWLYATTDGGKTWTPLLGAPPRWASASPSPT